MARRTKGDGSTFPVCAPRHGCPPVDPDTKKRPDHKCRAPWRGVVDLGWVGGKRVRRSVTRPTLRELRPAFRDLQKRMEGGVTEEDVSVEAWFTLWLDTIAARRVRPRTLDTYRGYVKAWVVPYLGRHRLSKLRPEHIEAMYDEMRKAGRADATVRQVHAIVKRALKDAVQRERLLRSPADVAEAPAVPKAHHAYLDVAAADAVLKGARDKREAARLTVALLLGLRQSEALGLRWADVMALEDGWGRLAVERGVQRHKGMGLVVTELKTESSRRNVPLIPGVAKVLEDWRAESGGEGYVFGGEKPTDPRKDFQAWREACIRAGVVPVPLHGARASTATVLQEYGVPDRIIADILGHSKVSTTQTHYLRSDEGQRRAALEQAGVAFGY